MNVDLRTFLKNLRPDAYTTFVSIVPDGRTSAATFNGADQDTTETWIEQANLRGQGVYFTLNPTARGTRRKPTKTDIAAIAGVWADLDPRDGAGHPLHAERERLAALADELQQLTIAPTLIINSGNGLQPIWLLADPIEASEDYRDAAEALCARIEAALGAKGTHNLDRLLRVPGTTNFPNERKRKLGRGETQARLLAASWRRYSWRDLEALAARLEAEPLEHAVPIESDPVRGANGHQRQTGLDLPDQSPNPLDTASLEALQASHPDAFDLANYDGDQSRQDLALANIARHLGWPPVDAWALIIAVRGDAKAARRDYIERTLGRAYAEQTDARSAMKGDALYDLSHDGLALDIGRRWYRDARHVALWGKWLFWTGQRWERDEKLLHMTRTRDYLRARGDALVRDAKAGKVGDPKDEEDIKKIVAQAEAIAKSLRNKGTIASVVDLARSNYELAAGTDEWDAHNWHLNTPTGIVDLQSGALMSHDPLALMTKITAAGPGGGCPLWLRFLDQITDGDKELQTYLQRSMGYALTGSTREHVLQFGHGGGANGKSVFMSTMSGILRDYATVAPMTTFTVTTTEQHPTDMAMLHGARLVVASETEQGKRWAESKIKSLTGGDPISARFMRQDFFKFRRSSSCSSSATTGRASVTSTRR